MLDWLAQQARMSGHKIALIQGGQCWTYVELNRVVAERAASLAAHGVLPRQHVAVLLANRAEYVQIVHALVRLGAVLVPLNVRLTGSELAWQVEHACCRHVICGRETEAQAGALAGEGRQLLSVDAPEGTTVQPLSTLAARDGCQWQVGGLDLDGVRAIVYTSGTTGRPKGAMLTHANFLWGATASAFRLGTEPRDRWLLCMPLYHVGGLAIVLRCCLYGTAVVLQDGFDPAAVFEAWENQGVTMVSLVPTMLHRLLDGWEARTVPSGLRCILLGGAVASPDLLARAGALGLPVAVTYGLTEAASQVSTAAPGETHARPGSVGRPLMFMSVRIVGQNGHELAPGEIGEIVVQGPTVMQGYWHDSGATQQALPGDGLHTGDMGYLDADGDLWVVQRRSDLIVTGGENVYPSEVEAVLRVHPAVQDACVVGVPDPEWGQRVAAAIVLRSGASLDVADVQAFCRARLAGYKLPRLIRCVPVLPQTASGKVQRQAVRDLWAGQTPPEHRQP